MFPQGQRLSKRTDFDRLFKQRPLIGQYFTIRLATNNLNKNRLAVVVPNKISKLAVVRNKIRRQTREAIKHLLRNDPSKNSKDLLVFFKRKPDNKYHIIYSELEKLLDRAASVRR